MEKRNAETESRHASALFGSRIETQDGEPCGKCRDLLFDDRFWTIRYVVADTGGFFSHREIVLSPFVFANPEFGAFAKHLPTKLTREQIESSPPLESDAPVSRRYEWELARYYDYPAYWGGSAIWGYSAVPIISAPDPAIGAVDPQEAARHEEAMKEIRESHLRSCDEMRGYELVCGEEELGRVVDFLVEPATWGIRFVEVETSGWFSGQKITLAPERILKISWEDHQIITSEQAREELKAAPAPGSVQGAGEHL